MTGLAAGLQAVLQLPRGTEASVVQEAARQGLAVSGIAEFRHEANDGKDAAIKTFAAQTLPTLEDHLKEAREVLHSVSATNVSHAKNTSHTGA